MQTPQKLYSKYVLLALIPLILFFVIAGGSVLYFPHSNTVHLASFFVALTLSIAFEFLIFRFQILPNFAELDKIRRISVEQEQGAKLLVRRDLELTRANERLSELDAVKSGFITVVAHQLRTPLSGVKWTLNLLLKGDLGALSDEQRDFLLKAYESNDRMISLVNDMLGADRVESGSLSYSFSAIPVWDVAQKVLLELTPLANTRKLSIRLDPGIEGLPEVHADPERVRAVFQNLLENSLKYSLPPGEVVITGKTEGDFIRIGVTDKGIGIPKNEQKNVFERFFRAGNALKLETEGTGLGLFIARSIIKRHGGRIWFESGENTGATFFFTLPIARAHGQRSAKKEGQEA